MTKTYNANYYTGERYSSVNCTSCIFVERSGYDCDDEECSLLVDVNVGSFGAYSYSDERHHPDCPLAGGKSITVKWEKE